MWLVFVLLFFMFVGLKRQVPLGSKPGNINGGILLMNNGFEEGVEIAESMNWIIGSDVPGFNWQNTSSWISSSRFVYKASGEKLNREGAVNKWYDDFELWSSFPTDHPVWKKENPLKTDFSQSIKEKVIFQESFNYPDGGLPPSWWSEGNAAKIKNGRLFLDADTDGFRVGTVWLDRKLSGNFRIEYDVQIVSSSDTANNINCFLLYSDPGGVPLRESQVLRKNGSYSAYHNLNGYIFTFLANGNPVNARIRFRDNPGFNLLAEDFGFECKSGETYRIKIEKTSNNFQYWVNEELLLEKVDNEYNEVHQTGYFGFRTWHTALWWANLVITQLD